MKNENFTLPNCKPDIGYYDKMTIFNELGSTKIQSFQEVAKERGIAHRNFFSDTRKDKIKRIDLNLKKSKAQKDDYSDLNFKNVQILDQQLGYENSFRFPADNLNVNTKNSPKKKDIKNSSIASIEDIIESKKIIKIETKNDQIWPKNIKKENKYSIIVNDSNINPIPDINYKINYKKDISNKLISNRNTNSQNCKDASNRSIKQLIDEQNLKVTQFIQNEKNKKSAQFLVQMDIISKRSIKMVQKKAILDTDSNSNFSFHEKSSEKTENNSFFMSKKSTKKKNLNNQNMNSPIKSRFSNFIN